MKTTENKRTFVYVDGYNLYYGSLKRTEFKWLDPRKLCENILSPSNQILNIKYFTARVSDRKNDPAISTRQNFYFKALETIENLEIVFGHYLSHPTTMVLANPPLFKKIMTGLKGFKFSEVDRVEVIKTEEKGSDVNIASNMLIDAFNDKFDVAVVISNDSDLALPVELVARNFKKKVVILNPHNRKKRSKELNKFAAKTIEIDKDNLKNSQFSDPVVFKDKKISKPKSW